MTLGITYEKVTYTSEYLPQLMEMAEKLMREGKAYVDDIEREAGKKGTPSKCRDNTVDENLRLWKEMISGSERRQKCFLRGKLDMEDKNKTYDFACPFVDSIEGITHALRSSKYHDRNTQYQRIQEDIWALGKFIYMSLAG